MDCIKLGYLIRSLRQEKQMTQKQLADKMNVSDKAISKWERGVGCPDISFIVDLSQILEVNIEELLNGELSPNNFVGGNMKKSKYYVCPMCGNIIFSTGNASIACCGRKLDELKAKKAEDGQKLLIEQVEDDWFITSNNQMTKDNYISFVSFATGDKVQVIKQYPEWSLQIRLPKRSHGILFWYSLNEGFLYQFV